MVVMRAVRPTRILAATCSLVILAGGCGGGGNDSTGAGEPSGPQKVNISNYTYEPANLTVPAGTKVTFLNRDSTAHTATSKQRGSFDTGPIQPGRHATVAFDEPGTFVYYCVFHPFMKGTVRVE